MRKRDLNPGTAVQKSRTLLRKHAGVIGWWRTARETVPTLARLTGGQWRGLYRTHCTPRHANRLGRIDPRERRLGQRGGCLYRAVQASLRLYRRGRSPQRRSPTRAGRRTIWTRCADFVMTVRSRPSEEVLHGNVVASRGVGNFGGVLGVSQGSRLGSRNGNWSTPLPIRMMQRTYLRPPRRRARRQGRPRGRVSVPASRAIEGNVRNGAARLIGRSLRGRSES